MKKLLCMLLLLSLLAGCASASGVKIGHLPTMNLPESRANVVFAGTWHWSVFAEGHGEDDRFVYYDSLGAMLLALEKGEVDEIDLPEVVAEYILNTTTGLKVSCVMKSEPVYYAFGFIGAKEALRQRFDEALRTLESSGTLGALRTKYLNNPGREAPDAVRFEHYEGAETIRVAVTGDLPPLDYAGADGEPAGFSTAVLAEIGRLMKVNITTLNIDSGAKAAALTSGRADAVFWFTFLDRVNIDVPGGVIISRPYYTTEYFLQLKKK